jgi:hypothetical protein
LEEKDFYGIFAYMLQKRKNLDETLMTWKKYEGKV